LVLKCLIAIPLIISSLLGQVQGPTKLAVQEYGRASFPAWPWPPCYDGPIWTYLEFDSRVYDSDDAAFSEPDADLEWNKSYSILMEKLDQPSWTPKNSNITIPDGPLLCHGAAGPIQYFIVSGFGQAEVVFRIGNQDNVSLPVILYNTAEHITRTFLSNDPSDERYVEFAPFYVPNDPSLIGLSIFHQGFIIYQGKDGFFGLLSSQGIRVDLLK